MVGLGADRRQARRVGARRSSRRRSSSAACWSCWACSSCTSGSRARAGRRALSSDLAVPLTILWVVALAERGEPGRRARRARRRHGGDRRRRRSSSTWCARDEPVRRRVGRGAAVGDHRRHLRGVPAVELPPGEDLHGRLGLDAARHARWRSRRSPASGRNPLPPSGGDLAADRGPARWCRCSSSPIPFLDVVLAIVRRTWRGRGSATPTRSTSTIGLMDIGHSHRSAVLLMYLWSAADLARARSPSGSSTAGSPSARSILLAALVLFARDGAAARSAPMARAGPRTPPAEPVADRRRRRRSTADADGPLTRLNPGRPCPSRTSRSDRCMSDRAGAA